MTSCHRLLLTFTLTFTSLMSASSQLIFLGTNTQSGASQGIYAVHLDTATGELDAPVVAAETRSPTFLAWGPDHRVLYALGEGPAPDGQTTAGLAAFAFDPAAGKISLLNRRGTGGGGTTHLAVDAAGQAVVTVSYGSGYVASFPLGADGRIGERASFIPHQGPLGPNPVRQEKPHPHSVTLSPDNRFAFVADLGLDRVFSYRLGAARGTLTPNDPAFIAVTPGSGPRHTKFSQDGRFFYILGEIDGSVTVCAYDAATGTGTPIQHTTTLPAGFKVTDADRAAEIRVHPNGQFVYASNRGHDSIAVFAVNADGTLRLIEITPCGGKHPRNFSLSPDGNWLVCANMDSNTLTAFKVDARTGRISPSGHPAIVPQPVCVLFAP